MLITNFSRIQSQDEHVMAETWLDDLLTTAVIMEVKSRKMISRIKRDRTQIIPDLNNE